MNLETKDKLEKWTATSLHTEVFQTNVYVTKKIHALHRKTSLHAYLYSFWAC